MSIQVYRAKAEDAEALFELNERFNGAGSNTLERIRASLETNNQEAVFLVKIGDTVAGFCCVQVFHSMCYSRHYAEITELFIDEGFRRQGVGTKLLRKVEEHFCQENIAGFQLFTGAKNLSAQMFYEHLGYQRTGEVMYRKRIES